MSSTMDFQKLGVSIIDEEYPNTTGLQDTSTGSGYVRVPFGGTAGKRKRLLINFSIDDQRVFEAVLKNMALYVMKEAGSGILYLSVLSEPFNAATVTWNTRPAKVEWGDHSYDVSQIESAPITRGAYLSIAEAANNWDRIREAALNGFELYFSKDSFATVVVNTAALQIELDPLEPNISNINPATGSYVHKSEENTFQWSVGSNALANNPPQEYWPVQTSAIFQWRASETSAVNQISAGSQSYVKIPANTFSTASIQWRVIVEASDGAEIASAWMTCVTVDTLSSAVAIYPKNTIVDGTVENEFVWEHINATGTMQTAFDLQISSDGKSWSTVKSQSTSNTTTKLPAGTIQGSTVFWRVRTYNIENVAGEWSDPVQCAVVSAPAAPFVTIVEATPKFAIKWQQSGQQAYELMVDGVVIAKTFSAESFYRHNGYLNPGTHKVEVRIQNKYQMWSEWGTANLQIENVEGAEIQLSATENNEVFLIWSTSGVYDSYIVYRNGIKIAETAEMSYVDHFAIGKALYQVRGVYADSGNYTMSNTAIVTVSPDVLLIADVSDPVWIELPLSTSSLRSSSLSASQSVTYTHYVGAGLPGAEIGEAVNKSYTLDCAFKATDLERIQKFESLLGKIVCIKTMSQRRIFGVLSQLSAKENRFYVAYSAPITAVRWEEVQE